jgi:hypothetical protein
MIITFTIISEYLERKASTSPCDPGALSFSLSLSFSFSIGLDLRMGGMTCDNGSEGARERE